MVKLILILLLAIPGMAAAQVAAPETPTLHVFNQWLAAVNTRDPGKMTDFWKKYSNDPPADHVANDQRLVTMTNGFTLVKIVKDDGQHIEALLKEGRGVYSVLIIDLNSTNPPIIRGLFGHPVPDPTEATVAAASNDDELAAQVISHAADPAAKDSFSGAVLIAHDGRLVLNQAWGLADSEKRIKNTTGTQFCLGSMNKMFTAVAVLQLVQQGKLSLDGTISDYWPGYPNHDLATRVKIRQLLSHTGGTGDIFTPEFDAHRLEIRTLADYVKLYGSRPVAFEPGSRMEYSNYGFILLGRLVEIASGEDYQSYVQKHIFAQAGMTHSDSRPEVEHVAGRAVGYVKGAGGLQPNTATLPWSGTSAGGGYSTVGDLLLFANALQSGKLLDPALLRRATSDQSHTGYGFGFYVLGEGGYGHGGGSPGMNGEMHILPSRGYVIIALANRDPFMATEMVKFIESILPDQKKRSQVELPKPLHGLRESQFQLVGFGIKTPETAKPLKGV
jgi:CubicO group peptidase (beta-lactamase class C family)